MLSTTLRASHRIAASLTICSVLLSLLGPIPTSQASSSLAAVQLPSSIEEPETITLEKAPLLLAHHEGSVGASQLLTSRTTAVGGALTKSLWGNMILSMAIQQDPEIQRIGKKLGRMSGLLFTSVGVISALSVAQGIDGLVTLQQDPHPYHPPILGLIGSGLSLLSVGTQAAMSHHYKKALQLREGELAQEIERILAALKTEGVNDASTEALVKLIGDEASQEFIGLWAIAHPHP